MRKKWFEEFLRGMVVSHIALPLWDRILWQSIALHQILKRKKPRKYGAFCLFGGEREIRTLVRFDPKHAFQACALSHSATSPEL
jgi:hypothetical protein